MTDRRLATLALCLVAALSFWAYGVRDLTYFDEPRYAGIAREMSEANAWKQPLLYGEPYAEKPPLYFWCAELAGRALGFDAWAFFLPNVIAHFLSALLVFDLGRRFLSLRAGAAAALIFAACPLELRFARSAQLDALLTFGETLTAWGLLVATRARSAVAPIVLSALGFAAASLVKGHIALFGLLPGLIWCVRERRFPPLRRPLLSLAWIALAFAPLATWLWLLAQQIGADELIRRYWKRQVVERTAGSEHRDPWPVGVSYLGALAAMLPMIAFLPGAFRRTERAPAQRTFLWWAIVEFTIFALVPSKRELYLMPLVAPLALVLGEFVVAVESCGAPLFRGGREIGAFFAALLGIGALGFPIFLATKHELSVDAVLLAVAGVPLAVVVTRRFLARAPAAPLLLALQVAVVSVFAEPALGRFATAEDGGRAFGAEIQRIVPADASIVVQGFSKAHDVSFFGHRRPVFADRPTDVAQFVASGGEAFVVVKGKDDAEEFERDSGLAVERIAVEGKTKDSKAMRLYRARAAPAPR